MQANSMETERSRGEDLKTANNSPKARKFQPSSR